MLSMTSPDLRVERPADGVALVSLARAERLNALTGELVDDLSSTVDELGQDRSCRAIVLTGTGRGFCAGLDLKTGGEGGSGGDARESDPVAERLAAQERFAGMIRAIRASPAPVVAAVNGPAAGAGFALALACDARLASASATFHVASIRIGLSGGECGMSYLLPRLVGASLAFELLLSGRPVDAEEAARVGLVSRVVPEGTAGDAGVEMAGAIAANSPFAVAMTKRVMWTNLDNGFDAALELENRTQVLATFTEDAAEARTAFLERRSPRFRGP